MAKYSPIDGFSKYIACSDGYVINTVTGKIIKGAVKKSGYVEITIISDKKKQKSKLLHRIIAKCFCEGYEEGKEVNHIDGNKSNNSAKNLEWVTHNENLFHAFSAGLREQNVSAKGVRAVNMETGEELFFNSIYSAARALNISQGNICMCCKGMRPYAGGYIWEYCEQEDK